MDDGDREGKLAAGRKIFKALQKKNSSRSGAVQKSLKKKKEAAEGSSLDNNSAMEPKHEAQDIPSESLEAVEGASMAFDPRTTSSSENIRQISMQLNGLVSQTQEFVNGEENYSSTSASELEKRNQQLAHLLESEKNQTENFSLQLEELNAKLAKVQREAVKERELLEEKQHKEQTALKEQLQVHIQTIGILVAEKTELQSSLMQMNQTAKQKAAEIEELQGRLKASRQKLADIERDLATTTSSNRNTEKNNKELSQEIDRLKLEVYRLVKSNEEFEQLNSELQKKLDIKIQESTSQQEIVDDLQKRLSLAELRLKQFVTGDDQPHNYLEEFQKEKVELENQLQQHKDDLKRMVEERNQITENYKKFSQQLNQELESLTVKVASLSEDNETVRQQNKSLSDEITVLRDKNDASGKVSEETVVNDAAVKELEDRLIQLEQEKSRLSEDMQDQVASNSQLSNLLEEKESRIFELEQIVREAESKQVDARKLVETMQSDKIAASRAVAQNRDLKQQLEELQNGFVTLSNAKLELAEKVHAEQHVSKELSERIVQQEEELKDLRDHLSDREQQLSLLQRSSTEITKQMYQHHQIADRMRHFEAQGQLTELLQQELNQAQERINALNAQNGELRTLLANQAETLLKRNESEGQPNFNDVDSNRKDELVVTLSSSVRQLELERNQLLKQLEDQKQQHKKLKTELQEKEDTRLFEEHTNGMVSEDVSMEEHSKMSDAMKKLEEKFTKTMKQIADLSEEKQRLEYLVMQLQGETETIGDYIALYQTQRNVMKQQFAKKDEYIALVCQDKEELKEKLAQLQKLVYSLLFEREQTEQDDSFDSKHLSASRIMEDSNEILNAAFKSSNGILESETVDGLTDENGESKSRTHSESSVNSTNTAKKIIDLISEIGSSDLMDKAIPESFHPCPVCSGRLMTI